MTRLDPEELADRYAETGQNSPFAARDKYHARPPLEIDYIHVGAEASREIVSTPSQINNSEDDLPVPDDYPVPKLTIEAWNANHPGGVEGFLNEISKDNPYYPAAQHILVKGFGYTLAPRDSTEATPSAIKTKSTEQLAFDSTEDIAAIALAAEGPIRKRKRRAA